MNQSFVVYGDVVCSRNVSKYSPRRAQFTQPRFQKLLVGYALLKDNVRKQQSETLKCSTDRFEAKKNMGD